MRSIGLISLVVLVLSPCAASRAAALQGIPAKQVKLVPVPDVHGKTLPVAERIIRDARLKVGRVDSVKAPSGLDTVLGQVPRPGDSLLIGGAVNLRLLAVRHQTIPPAHTQLVTVPQLNGMTRDEAVAALARDSLLAKPGLIDDAAHVGRVTRQDPAAGQLVAKRTTVKFWYGAAVVRPPDTGSKPLNTAKTTVVLVPIPDLTGLRLDSATDRLRAVGLDLVLLDDPAKTGSAGHVVEQRPGGPQRMPIGTKVGVVLGPMVPDVMGRPQDNAQATIERAGLLLGQVQYTVSDSPPRSVISQDPPAGRLVRARTRVVLGVALPKQPPPDTHVVQVPVQPVHTTDSAPPSVVVPDLLHHSRDRAAGVLAAAGLRLGPVTFTELDGADSTVVEQRPGAGTNVPRGASESLTIAVPPTLVTVPAVVGHTLEEATALLERAPLTVGELSYVEQAGEPGRVVFQDPAAESPAKHHSPVRLRLAKAVSMVEVPDLVGKTRPQARQTLADKELLLGTVRWSTKAASNGTVIRQDPAAGSQAPRGAQVSVTMAAPARKPPHRPDSVTQRVVDTSTVRATPMVTVPSVLGLRPDSAASLLGGVSLVGRLLDTAIGYAPGGVVVRQEPAPTTRVPSGSVIQVLVGRGEPIPWLLILAGTAGLVGGVGALLRLAKKRLPTSEREPPSPEPQPPPPLPTVWLEPHLVLKRHEVLADHDRADRHEVQLTPHAGAATQAVDGDDTFYRELP